MGARDVTELDWLRARVMELERDCKLLRAEIEALQRMRHAELEKKNEQANRRARDVGNVGSGY